MLADRKRNALFVLILFFIATACLAQDTLSASDLIASSNSASDLSKLGPYRLKAIIVVQGSKQEATGTLTLDRDHDNARQELEFTDYHEVNITRGDQDYLSRKPYVPVDFSARLRKFDQLWQVTLPPQAQPGPVARARVQGAQALCFDLHPEKDLQTRNCFDPATHLLISRNVKVDSVDQETQFLDYQEIDGIRFPSTIRFLQPGSPVIEARNIALVKMPFDAAHFAPLPGAREFHTCRGAQPARVTRKAEPQYPQMAKVAHIQGDVRLLLVIGEDGAPRDLHVISGHPILVQAALDAVKQWRYAPEMCPSGPVADEAIVKIRFRMGK
jgi:TonB family protein